ncbi:DNA polymerase-4 [Litorimonas taeanensis]|uniref:DNA-directed DNA polymerase n=1 Tax=Litorimonas taeanensis TaxID=568099 RepID=A0A420WDV2_9PROT|nr:type VI secretion protein ImpB [Litorimonas taeanensis]RKQ69173.1 DNA polymerase-4 [Litorimonas taeanensis]
MKKPTKLTTLYIDFDAFFANVEKQLSPDFHSFPTAVSAFPSEHSALIAQCYLAKAFGLHRGMKVKDAKALCPDLRVISARHDVYVTMHHKIIAAIEKHIPVKKVWSVDEMECDFGALRDKVCIEISQAIREQLSRDIGPYITPSIGLSSSNLLAKIAAEMNKPNGFEILHPRDLPGRLLNVPLRDVPGIAGGIEARLGSAGIRTMSDLWYISNKQARALWHSVEGERIWWMLRGYNLEKAPTKRAMYGHSRQLSGDWTTPKRAQDCLRLLTCQAARRMRKDGYLSSRLTVSLRDQKRNRYSAESQFSPIRDDHSVLRYMLSAFDKCMKQHSLSRISSVYITLQGLSTHGNVSQDIFSTPADTHAQERLSRLSDIIDSTNSRFQSDCLTVGLQEQPPGDYAGGKIAFGRIPDAEAYLKQVQTRSP